MNIFSIKKSGFTLIEILIILAIIGIIITTLYPSLRNYYERSKRANAVVELTDIKRMILQQELSEQKSLGYMTSSSCTACACRKPSAGGNGITSSTCLNSWRDALLHIEPMMGSGRYEQFSRDPWGFPYLLDENEDEYPGTCDTLESYGLMKASIPGNLPISRSLDASTGISCNDPDSSNNKYTTAGISLYE